MQDQDPQIIAQKKKMQMDILLKESDVKRIQRTKGDLEVSLREIKQKLTQLETEKFAKEGQLKKIDEEIFAMQNEILKTKRQMNSLGLKY